MTAADETLQRRSLARTVAAFAALLLALVAVVFLVAAQVFVQVFAERAALSAAGAVVVSLLGLLTYRLVSRYDWVLQRLAWLARWLPPLAQLLAEMRRRQAIGTVVERMEYVVSFYGLRGIFGDGQIAPAAHGSFGFRHPLRDELIEAIAAGAGTASWPEELIDQLVRCNTPSWTEVEPELLLLFYEERLEKVDPAFWQRIVNRRRTLEAAARTLLASGKLPLAPDFPCQPADLVVVIEDMQRFELDRLRERVRRLNALAERASNYLVFLHENGVAPAPSPLVPGVFLEIIKRTRKSSGPDAFDPGCFEVDATALLEIGRDSIRQAITQGDTAMLGRYGRLAAVIFLMRSFPRDPARELLCRELAADRKAVEIAWAYLDLKEDLRSEHRLGGRSFLSLSHLIEQWPAKLAGAAGNTEIAKEIDELTSILQRGEWLVHLSDLLERAQSTRLQQLLAPHPTPPSQAPPRDELARRALVALAFDQRPELLRRLFRDLEFETIERNLETRRFTPYLITFDTELGPLARLIDCLTSREKLSLAGVPTFENGGRAKYNFRPYTGNARIGLVPPGWTFEEFRNEFQQDLTRVLEHREKLVLHDGTKDLSGIEVMLHRFDAFGRSHYPFVSEFSTRFALRSIKELLADNLAPEELLTLVQYGSGGDLRARILNSPIPDVVGTALPLKPVERKALGREDGLVKGELLARLQVASISDLGQRLREGEIQHAQAEDALAQIIRAHSPRFTGRRSKLVARSYLQSIESLSTAA